MSPIFSTNFGGIFSETTLAAGVVTEGNLRRVDLNSAGLNREFCADLVVLENATAPGAARTITINYYWSNVNLDGVASDAERILQLAGRKNNFTAITRISTASSTRYFSLTSATTGAGLYLRPLGRYLYVSVTKTTEDSGSIPTITLNLVRVPAVATPRLP